MPISYDELNESDKISIGLHYARCHYAPKNDEKEKINFAIEKTIKFFGDNSDNIDEIVKFLACKEGSEVGQKYQRRSRMLLIANLHKKYNSLVDDIFEMISKYRLYDALHDFSYVTDKNRSSIHHNKRTVLYSSDKNQNNILALLIKRDNFSIYHFSKKELKISFHILCKIEYLILCNAKREKTIKIDIAKDSFLITRTREEIPINAKLAEIDAALKSKKEEYKTQDLPSFSEYVLIRQREIKERENTLFNDHIMQAEKNHDASDNELTEPEIEKTIIINDNLKTTPFIEYMAIIGNDEAREVIAQVDFENERQVEQERFLRTVLIQESENITDNVMVDSNIGDTSHDEITSEKQKSLQENNELKKQITELQEQVCRLQKDNRTIWQYTVDIEKEHRNNLFIIKGQKCLIKEQKNEIFTLKKRINDLEKTDDFKETDSVERPNKYLRTDRIELENSQVKEIRKK